MNRADWVFLEGFAIRLTQVIPQGLSPLFLAPRAAFLHPCRRESCNVTLVRRAFFLLQCFYFHSYDTYGGPYITFFHRDHHDLFPPSLLPSFLLRDMFLFSHATISTVRTLFPSSSYQLFSSYLLTPSPPLPLQSSPVPLPPPPIFRLTTKCLA